MINKIIESAKRIIENISARKYHWYEVRYIYNVKGNKVFDFVNEIGLSEKKTILNQRQVKKATKPLHKVKQVKNLLNNGQFNVEVMCYLGYFKAR